MAGLMTEDRSETAPEERRKRDEAATRAFVRLCEKAKCLLDSPRAFDPVWMLERLRHYKAARGYSLAHVAQVIQDYRGNCCHEPRPAHGPHECPDCGVRSYGLGFMVLQPFWSIADDQQH